jgi:hypothetical protein
MIKYITIITALLLASCGPKFIRSKPLPPAHENYNQIPDFKNVDTNEDGKISKTEYQIAQPKQQEIDITTPVSIFAWVVVTMLIVCILSVFLPKAMRLVRRRVKARREKEKMAAEERIVLND